jgi:hypothetical protein
MRQERAEDRRRHVRKVVYNPHSVSHPKTVDVAAKLKKRQVKNGVPVRRESAPDRNGKKLGSVPTLHVQQFGESNRAPSMRPNSAITHFTTFEAFEKPKRSRTQSETKKKVSAREEFLGGRSVSPSKSPSYFDIPMSPSSPFDPSKLTSGASRYNRFKNTM